MKTSVGDPASMKRVRSRRNFLGGAAASAGAVGLIVSGADQALATHTDDLDGYYNVKEHPFLATGDGSTDDGPAINAAITAAANASPAGGVVWFPPGEYATSERIVCRSNVWLRGAGSKSVIKAKTDNIGQVIYGESVSNVVVEALVVDGNRADRPAGTKPEDIRLQGIASACRNVHVRECEIRESLGFGCFFTKTEDSSISNCWVHHTGKDVSVGGDGINVSLDVEDIRIEGNLIEETNDDSIGINQQFVSGGTHFCRRITVADNVIIGGPEANSCVGLHGCREAVVTGNVISKGQTAGVVVTNSFTAPAADVIIDENIIVEGGSGTPTGGAVRISGAANDFGVPPDVAGCERIAVRDNVIVNSRQAAVGIGAQAGGPLVDVTVAGNSMYFDPGFAGIDNASRGVACLNPVATVTNLRITGNTVRSPRAQGIILTGSTIKRAEIRGNRVFDCGFVGQNPPGIEVTGVDGAVIGDNLSTDTGSPTTQQWGLLLSSPTGNVEIVGNDFTGNAAAPVLISGTAGASRLRIRDNLGLSPWSGEITTANGAWASFTPFSGGPSYRRKDVTVTFGVAFPSGQTPKVTATTRSPGFAVSVLPGATPHLSQTLQVWVPTNTNPATSVNVVINWVAESTG